MQEKGKIWVEARNVTLTDKVFKKARQYSSVQKENSNQIKLNQIKYNQIYFLELNITMQLNFIYKVTGVLGDLWGVTTKILVHCGVRNKNSES